MRKGFNFYASYYEVYKELSNKDKVAFMDALLKKQFCGVDPDDLEGMAKFAYVSQKHSIDAQVKGWEDKTGQQLQDPTEPPYLPPTEPPAAQEKEKVQEKEKEQEQDVYRKFDHLVITKVEFSKLEKDYTKAQVDNILDQIENFAKNKKYKSLYLTAKNWLKKEPKKNSVSSTLITSVL